jgi:hypothetical protein
LPLGEWSWSCGKVQQAEPRWKMFS